MSISSTDRIAGPFTSGTVLPFSFVVFVPADVRVIKTSADGEILPDLVSPADYSVVVNPDQNVSPGGQVTLTAAISGGASVVVTSRLENTQPVTITNLGAFLPETLNKAFDRQCILTQQVATKVDGALQFPVSDANAQTPVLPPAAVRANQAIVFDGDGNVAVGAVASATVSPAMQPVVAASTLSSARTALGASVVGDSLFTAASAAAARTAIGAGTGNGNGNGDMLAATYDPANIAQQLVGTTATQTLTNKKVTTQASTTTEAMLTVTPGVAPTTPNNGDVWVTSSGVFARVNAVTQQLSGLVTPWVAYTPTFTGFGTPTNVNFYSRRNGNDLEIRGAFTSGTSTATEARITYGFNGVNSPAGLVADSAVITTSPRLVGMGVFTTSTAIILSVLAESGLGYMTFGWQGGTAAGLTKQNGNAIIGTPNGLAFQASIPMTGW